MPTIDENIKIVTTPRIIATLIAGSFLGYFWLTSTFWTRIEAQEAADAYTESHTEIETKLEEHIQQSSIYRVNADLQDTQDKLWTLNEQIRRPNGDTSERREKAEQYTRRIVELQELKMCIQEDRTVCIIKID